MMMGEAKRRGVGALVFLWFYALINSLSKTLYYKGSRRFLNLKILYFGGQKSGKSNLAKERATLLGRNKKPIFIATYDNSFGDLSMQKRVQNHQKERGDSFITVEETLYLDRVIKDNGRVYLIDCISMWVLNSIDWKVEKLLHQLENLKNRKADIYLF